MTRNITFPPQLGERLKLNSVQSFRTKTKKTKKKKEGKVRIVKSEFRELERKKHVTTNA